MSQVGIFSPDTSGSGDVLTLTGNSGGAVGPDGSGNIDLLGTGSIDVTGDPGTNTLTISNNSTLTGNSGGAVGQDVSGNINVVGTGSIDVTGDPGTNTLTISTSAAILNYRTVNTTPYVVASTDQYLSVDPTTLAITIQLPNSTTTGRVIYVKAKNGLVVSNNITITTVGGVVLIDGAGSQLIVNPFDSFSIIFNGSSYELF